MTADVRKRGFLLTLAAEAVAPAVGGCAGALAGGPVGGVAGVLVGQVVERAINFFGQHIARRWSEWLHGQPKGVQLAAIAELADLPPDRARKEAAEAVGQFAPSASAEDRQVAVEYLTAIPRAVQRSLVLDQATGTMTLPHGQAADDPRALLRMLPTDVPPYPPGSEVPGTPYRLGELIGSGGFGAVYRATAPSLQHLTFALKFCLDRSLVTALRQERANLERLIAASQGKWTDRIVRLYGYDLDHATPFLVYEYVPGGDLTALLTNLEQQTGRGFAPDEVFALVRQIAEALAYAHERGLVHRDLKPANVLVSGEAVKLADFGIGSFAGHAAQHSRIGSSVADQLSCDEQVSLFRGAGTPLYMSPEQRRGEAPDPRHDLYSLGVLWYQLLIGDVTRELHPGWAKELTVRSHVPAGQVALLEQCVGWFEDRPRDAAALLALMRAPAAAPAAPAAPSAMSPEEVRAGRFRKQRLLADLRDLSAALGDFNAEEKRARTITVGDVLLGVVVGFLFLFLLLMLMAAR